MRTTFSITMNTSETLNRLYCLTEIEQTSFITLFFNTEDCELKSLIFEIIMNIAAITK